MQYRTQLLGDRPSRRPNPGGLPTSSREPFGRRRTSLARFTSLLLLATLLFASTPVDAARKRARRSPRRGLAPVGAPAQAPLSGPRRVALQAANQNPEETASENLSEPGDAREEPASKTPAKATPVKPAPTKPTEPAPAKPAPSKEEPAPAEPAAGEPAPAAEGAAEAPAAAAGGEDVATWGQCGGTVPSQKGGSDAVWSGSTKCASVNDTCVYLSKASSTCIPIVQSRGYGCSSPYGQCGNADGGATSWAGPYCCAPETQCIFLSPGYSQCKPCQGAWSQVRGA